MNRRGYILCGENPEDSCDFCSVEARTEDLLEWHDYAICRACHEAEWKAEEREPGPAMAVWHAEGWQS
jgi:hypothetical protein